MKRSLLIRLNVFALAVWYLLLPFAGKTVLMKFGGVDYDVSRIIGLAIIYGNTIMLPVFIRNNITKGVLYSIMAFLLYAFVHVFTSPNMSGSLNIFVRVYSGFLIFVLFCSYTHEEDEKLIERFLLLIGLYTAMYTIVQIILYKFNQEMALQFFGPRAFVGSYSTVRPQGPLLSAGGSSSVIAISIILLLKKLFDRKFKPYYVILLLVMLAALFVNFTRTNLFPLFVMTFGCFVLYKRYKELIVSAVLAMFVILLYMSIFGTAPFMDRFKDVPGVGEDSVKNEQLMQGRGQLVKIVYSDLKKKDIPSIILGDGLNYTNVVLGKYYHTSGDISTHNDFMWLLSNMGIIGLVLYLMFYVAASLSYQGISRPIYLFFLITFMLFGGLGGETICITGHRFIQFIFLAYLIMEYKVIRIGMNPKALEIVGAGEDRPLGLGIGRQPFSADSKKF